MAGGTVLPALDWASTCRRVWMTRSRRPGVGTAACWVVTVRGGSAAGRQRLTEPPSLLPPEGGASGSQAWTLIGEAEGSQRSCPQVPAVRTSPLVCPACPTHHLGPGHSELGLTAQDVGWPLAGPGHSAAQACQVTGQGHRFLRLQHHPVVPPPATPSISWTGAAVLVGVPSPRDLWAGVAGRAFPVCAAYCCGCHQDHPSC